MRTQSNTFGHAAATARTGAQQIDEDAALHGDLRLDQDAAEQAALDHLTAHGLTGTVTVDGLEVTVTAHTSIDSGSPSHPHVVEGNRHLLSRQRLPVSL